MPVGRVERLQIMLKEEELAVIDDWRFERRMPSRQLLSASCSNVDWPPKDLSSPTDP